MKKAALLFSIIALSFISMAQDITPADYSAYILTPKAPDTPRINGPKVYGARPKTDFLFRIPATGVRPMTFSAKGLPRGLKLDAAKGIITGKARRKGEYKVTLTATNALGSDSRV
ncbi:MAG: putative Ig domain-containing protein, partial [Bacteroidales bacterium]|nr:putative Ig domain-containing protein [Bacteroidales bacterium]